MLTTPDCATPTPDAASHAKPDPDRLARLVLNHAVEPADPLIGRVLTRHSPADVLAAIHADQLADLDPDPARRARLIDRCAGLKLRLEPGQVESGIAAADAVGARFIVPGDGDWPSQLDDLGELRPIGIWVTGRWPPTPIPTSTRTPPSTPPPTPPSPSTSTSTSTQASAPANASTGTRDTPTSPGTPNESRDTPPPYAPAGRDEIASSGTRGMHEAHQRHEPHGRHEAHEGHEGQGALPTPAIMIAVVGARACTGYGAYLAGTIGADLAAAHIAVVSGAALGIDAAAHRGALAVGGPTVAVLACGIDRVYPRGHEVLLRAIAERGAVISELPPGASPTRFRFLHRNRIIAALGAGTVVVEAARRSGSLVTARLTAELGRVVMAVPGPVTSEQSIGTHELIRDGATLVTGAAQAREACTSLTEAALIAREAARAEAATSTTRREAATSNAPRRAEAATSGTRSMAPRANTEPSDPAQSPDRARAEPADPTDELVIEALPNSRGVAGADVLTLARASGLRPDVVFAALGRLAAAGRAVRAGGGWMLAPPE